MSNSDEECRRLLNPDEDSPRRTIRAAEYIAVRHSLPRSAVSRVILNINVCIQRQLDLEKDRLQRRESRYTACFEHNRRAFLENQTKKSSLWKNRDEMKMDSMNLPELGEQTERTADMQVLYTNPRYLVDEDRDGCISLMPYEHLRRSRTEIIRHNHDIYTSKLQTVTEINQHQLNRFKTFCAADFINDSIQDSRFRNLDNSLQRNKPGSPTAFVRWLAKRFPEGSSKDKTDFNYKYQHQHKHRRSVIFPSLTKNKPTATDAKAGERSKAKRGIEGIRHPMDGSGEKTNTGRQFNSPSHKHRFEVKSDVVTG